VATRGRFGRIVRPPDQGVVAIELSLLDPVHGLFDRRQVVLKSCKFVIVSAGRVFGSFAAGVDRFLHGRRT